MYMFNLHRPKNSEDEFMTDDGSAPALPRFKDLYPDTPKDILDEITDICEMRCEYNRELMIFFLSKSISTEEKCERYESLYPGLIQRKYKGKTSLALKDIISECAEDLRWFYDLLSLITQYKDKILDEDFPIFFEINASVEIRFFSSKYNPKAEYSSYEASFYNDANSEIPTYQHILKLLKPFIEQSLHDKFKSYYEFICPEAGVCGYQPKKIISTELNIYIKQFENNQTLHDKFLKKIEQGELVLTETSRSEFFKLAIQVKNNLKTSKELSNIIETYLNRYGTIFQRLALIPLSAARKTEYIRRQFYMFCDIEKASIDHLERYRILFKQQSALFQKPQDKILSPIKTTSPAIETSFSNPEVLPYMMEVKELKELKLNTPLSRYDEDEPTEEEILKLYSEFREKKLKQRFRPSPPAEESKDILEDSMDTMILKNLNRDLNSTHIQTLSEVFKNPIPHYSITWKELEKLINQCGGYIDNDTGSSRRIIRLPSYSTLVDVNQRGIHKRHKPGHDCKNI